jgi:hypothetical protein
MTRIVGLVRMAGLIWIKWRRSPPSPPGRLLSPPNGKKAPNGVFLEGQIEQAGNVPSKSLSLKYR